MRSRYRQSSLPSGVGLVVFVIVAAILASGLARVIGFLFHLVFQIVWYGVAFVIAMALLSWAWNRVTQTRTLDRSRWVRMPDERRRY